MFFCTFADHGHFRCRQLTYLCMWWHSMLVFCSPCFMVSECKFFKVYYGPFYIAYLCMFAKTYVKAWKGNCLPSTNRNTHLCI